MARTLLAPTPGWLLWALAACAACEGHAQPPAPMALSTPAPSPRVARRRRERFPERAPLPLVVALRGREQRAVSAKTAERFVGSDWPRVLRAAQRIESADRAGVAALVAVLRRNRRVALTNTGDLIYPGAPSATGDGRVIQYELDWTADRAGWVLEALTFEDFGFGSDSPVRAAPEPVARERRREAVRAVRLWWRERRARWSRLDAVRAALSGSPAQQRRVLHWLRFGATPCHGLTVGVFYDEVVPLVRGIYERTRDRESRELAADLLGRDAV